ncbi:polysaccharide deacetylase family protein [Mycolicibacterium chubuense]|uniref:polysaccharide deacetylase family protein n=1 Tax=Mycolicibacterium chubuense TaxID=1800 RepID=UPI00068612E9|nr:polysaccharide deacetylase family protein [Mycolicibacterium chubuense]
MQGQTVVSITFDDGRKSNIAAARMMTADGLAGTFFVNSMTIGTKGYLSQADLVEIARMGHEIGGHTMTHPDLGELTGDEVRRQICDDRENLLGWGFPIRSFAYPFASASTDAETAVRQCGYNSGRSLGELRTHRPPPNVDPMLSCQDCALAEVVPPADPMYTSAPAQVRSDWTASDLQQQVLDAMSVGGWIELTFHGLCPTDCNSLTTPQTEFGDFLAWLAGQQSAGKLLVRTVGDVIGGPVRPPIAGPIAPPAPPGANGVKNSGLEQLSDGSPVCWLQASFGRNRPEFSLSSDSHGGTTAGRLIMRDYVDGDAKLLQSTDLGHCAPSVSPGGTYTVSAWYKSTAPTSFSIQFRHGLGRWAYGLNSPTFPASTDYTLATWSLPTMPSDVTAVSFGLALAENGELIADDYSLVDDATASK